jgi:hypothetical protein
VLSGGGIKSQDSVSRLTRASSQQRSNLDSFKAYVEERLKADVWNAQVLLRELRVYGNRPRVRGERGSRLQRQRGEQLDRVNAHLYETGRMPKLEHTDLSPSTSCGETYKSTPERLSIVRTRNR